MWNWSINYPLIWWIWWIRFVLKTKFRFGLLFVWIAVQFKALFFEFLFLLMFRFSFHFQSVDDIFLVIFLLKSLIRLYQILMWFVFSSNFHWPNVIAFHQKTKKMNFVYLHECQFQWTPLNKYLILYRWQQIKSN